MGRAPKKEVQRRPAKMRIVEDSFGKMRVPADRLWGAQTERSRQFFAIGTERMPIPLIHALGHIKAAAARVNSRTFRLLDRRRADAIEQAATDVAAGRLDQEFPLSVWQTGSGTQTNMNANEVIAARAMQILRGKVVIHPNDHVNLSQSSNDTIPTAIHVAAAMETKMRLEPALRLLEQELRRKERQFSRIIKIGRTHLQDATPLTLGQEFSAYAEQIANARAHIAQALKGIMLLAQGGTAVGTGINAPKGFDRAIAKEISRRTGLRFLPAPNKFEALASHDAALALAGSLNGLAAALMKIGNDIRLLASGPRAGLGELILPANEPGSSIMPGKVNPTQAEALTMVAAAVIGDVQAITIGAMSGHLQLNVFKPLIAYSLLRAIRLLADVMDSFTRHCLQGLQPDRVRIDEFLHRSLMLVTALSPHIGYDKAARIAKLANRKNINLRVAAIESGHVTEAEFDRWVDPRRMI